MILKNLPIKQGGNMYIKPKNVLLKPAETGILNVKGPC
jgi:hypothetical protein